MTTSNDINPTPAESMAQLPSDQRVDETNTPQKINLSERNRHLPADRKRSPLLTHSNAEWSFETTPSSANAASDPEQSHTQKENDMTPLTTCEPARKKRRLSSPPEVDLSNASQPPQDKLPPQENVNAAPDTLIAIDDDSQSCASESRQDNGPLVVPPVTSNSQAVLAWLEQARNRIRGCMEEGDVMMARVYLQEATPIAFRAAQEGMCTRSYVAEHFIAQLGDACYQLGDYEDAVDHYTSAVQQERFDGELSIRPLKYLDAICHIYVEVRQYSYALCVFKEVYDLQMELIGPNSLEVGSTLCNMGLMHYMLGMYTPSLHFYQETLRISLNRLDECNRLSSLGKTLESQPALASVRKSVGDALNAMGLLYFKLHSYEKAASSFACALGIREEMLGPYHRDCIVMWYNLAMVRVEMGDPRRAVRLYEEGIRRERIALEKNECNSELSHTLQYLGEIYNKLGDIDNSLVCFQEALEIEKEQAVLQGNKQKENHWLTVCRLLNVVGNIYLMQADITATMTCFVEAARTSAGLVAKGGPCVPLVVAGHLFCHLSRSHPSSAPAA